MLGLTTLYDILIPYNYMTENVIVNALTFILFKVSL